MEEVSNPDGVGYTGQQDPATLAAWQEGMALKGREVVDVNGVALGKVAAAFAQDGALIRLDVRLTPTAKQLLGAERDVAGVPAVAIADVTEDEVRLKEAGEQIVHPEDARPSHATPDARGAPELPRKER